jgi:hypothetical protein
MHYDARVAGAVALRIERQPPGEERLVIQTRGGLITRKIPLKGDLAKDIQNATAAAGQIVASANRPRDPCRRLISKCHYGSRVKIDRYLRLAD